MPFQEQGWTNSGTSSSPATPTLLATAAATFTDPDLNLSQIRPVWTGLGLDGQDVDAGP